jgi:hypothetical protein
MHRNGRTRATNSVGLYNITTTATSPLKYANVYRDMRTRSTNNTAISTGPYSKHSLHGTLIKPQHPLLQPSNRKTTASVPRPRRKSHLTGPQAKPAASPSPATPYLQKNALSRTILTGPRATGYVYAPSPEEIHSRRHHAAVPRQ